jgi:hypothetical protein
MILRILLFSFLILLTSFNFFERTELLAPASNEISCQDNHSYKIMEIRNVDLSIPQIKIRTDFFIVIENTLPPVKWWQPFTPEKPGVLGKDSISNLNYYTTRHDSFKDQILVRIVNKTTGKKLIELPDRCLMLGLEALDKTGKWVEVEEHFRGICGNSFKPRHHKEVKPNSEILTYTKLFKGSTKTTYRLKFRTSRSDSTEIYSNGIEGTIDECKFVYKQF